MSRLFRWTPVGGQLQDRVIAPDERLPWPQTTAMGVQHVIAMFGATVLAPILMGCNLNMAMLMSGIVACGLIYLIIGAIVHAVGTGWIERLTPPVVTGSVVVVAASAAPA